MFFYKIIIFGFCYVSILANQTPKILTKHVHITSYEHHTVILPCEIQSLPQEMPVIWQYGKRGEINQTVLTIGGTQLENNYRVRVVTNSSEEKITESRVTIHNLEIRKLQSADSGWYECQLPTKPTQINYVYLEVLTLPRIEVSSKSAKYGDQFELVCQVKNLPKRFELNWYLNDKKLLIHKDPELLTRKKLKRNFDSFIHLKKRPEYLDSQFTILNEKFQNLTLSRLKIRDLNEQHKGVYKCKYDRVEAKYYLDVKLNPKTKYQIYDQLTSSTSLLQLNSVLFILILLKEVF